ncbi:hypothetical protein AOQ73_19255 [Bradyrhizobium pachyrhizi]|uniref:hypothetical protein n=1 Tax=Bradyrhizobium pachyrhizi TaxID=280333 RepID=UPI0007150E76|nr:hypothetical protein [Bradyrhizobium pachyrhizi]KRQ00344.1 hypothetical protein AOQ73_19255 [Bradyrhizobium pachyrhizi]
MPTKRRGIVTTVLGVITGLLGSTFGLMISVFALLSLPLNIIAVMHIIGWSWLGALIAVMGAYYMWDANFDWQKAVYPRTKTFSVSALSEAASQCECFATNFTTRLTRPGMMAFETDGRYPTTCSSE